MALPGSGQLSIDDITSISSRGPGGIGSIDWLENERTVSPGSTNLSISDFYGEGADWTIDWSSSSGTNLSLTSTLYMQYNRIVYTGTNPPQEGRFKIQVSLSSTNASYPASLYWLKNTVPTTGSYGTSFASSPQSSATFTIPVTVDYFDNLYITVRHSRPPATANCSYTLTLLSDGQIIGGLIDSFTASGTTTWSGGG